MAKHLKTRKFLSVIALFSCIAMQPQSIQAGLWSWITWPLYALFDSDKNAEQSTLPKRSENPKVQVVPPLKLVNEKTSSNRSWFSHLFSWRPNLRSFFGSLFSGKPKNNTSAASPETNNTEKKTQTPAPAQLINLPRDPRDNTMHTNLQKQKKKKLNLDNDEATDSDTEDRTNNDQSQDIKSARLTDPYSQESRNNAICEWMEKIPTDAAAPIYDPEQTIPMNLPFPSTSSSTTLVLHQAQPVGQQPLRNALDTTKITFDPANHQLIFNISNENNPENIIRFIIDTSDRQNLAKNLKNALMSLPEQDLQRLCEHLRIQAPREKLPIISAIVSHLGIRISQQPSSLSQMTDQQSDSDDSSSDDASNSDDDSLFNEGSEEDLSDNDEENPGIKQKDAFLNSEGSLFFEPITQDDANPIINAQKTFTLYPAQLEEFCNAKRLKSNEMFAYIKQRIDDGAQYAYEILTNPSFTIPKNELINIVQSLIWYFYSEHLGQTNDGIGFEEGTFIVPKEFTPIFEKAGHIRISSHVSKLNPGKNRGIECDSLPQDKRHILVIPFTKESSLKEYCFVKPENYGVSGLKALAGHTWEFILAQTRKTFIGKTIGMTPDDAQQFCKERIPAEVVKEYQALLPLCDEQNREDYDNAKKLGIFAMYREAMALHNSDIIKRQGNLANKKRINAFLHYLETKYDNLDIRIGREVILRKEDLLLSTELYRLARKDQGNKLLETGLTLMRLKEILREYRTAPDKDSGLLSNIKQQLTIIAQIDPKTITEHSHLQKYFENIKTVSKKVSSDNNAEFLENWTQKPFAFEFNHLCIDAHRIKTEERFSRLKNSTQTEMNQYNAHFNTVLKELQSNLLEFDEVNQHYTRLRQCRSELAVVEPLIQQFFSEENAKETQQLLQLLRRVTSESTGLGKVVEFRKILPNDFLSEKKRFDNLCGQITCTALALHKTKKTTEAMSLCNAVINMFDQFINTICRTAKENELFILEPTTLKNRALQLRKLIPQNGANGTEQPDHLIIESFENQLGFFGSLEERDQCLERCYNETEKTLKRQIESH